MSDITIKFRDGTERTFKHEGRAGGSYTKSTHYKGSFIVIEDEWGKETAFPAELVAEVITEPSHGRW